MRADLPIVDSRNLIAGDKTMREADSEIEQFRRATGAAMRAIAHQPELTAVFAPGQPGLSGTEARLPLPARDLPHDEVAQVRGEAEDRKSVV